MSKPSAETLEALKGARTEIGAGMVLRPLSEADHAHNGACEQAINIIRHYEQGSGLFQMTADAKRKRRAAR